MAVWEEYRKRWSDLSNGGGKMRLFLLAVSLWWLIFPISANSAVC
jgi:hypothetical protein